MAFDIVKYLAENKIEMGSIKKEVGTSVSKSGHNDIRKTNYDVKINEDGKLNLSTHKSIITKGKTIKEEKLNNRHVIGSGNTTSVGTYSDGSIIIKDGNTNIRMTNKKQVNNLIKILQKLSKTI